MIALLKGNSVFKLSSLNLDTNREGALKKRESEQIENRDYGQSIK